MIGFRTSDFRGKVMEPAAGREGGKVPHCDSIVSYTLKNLSNCEGPYLTGFGFRDLVQGNIWLPDSRNLSAT